MFQRYQKTVSSSLTSNDSEEVVHSSISNRDGKPQANARPPVLRYRLSVPLRGARHQRHYYDSRPAALSRGMDSQPPVDVGASEQPVELPANADAVPPAKRARTDASEIDWSAQDRQWDVRINLASGDSSVEDARKELDHFTLLVTSWSKVRFAHIGGIELGDNPATDDFGYYHSHVALILHTPNTRRSVAHNLGLATYKSGIPRSYYLAKRNPFKSFSGWIAHHSKERTKVTESYTHYSFGTPPAEYASQLVERGKPGKLKQDDMLREIIQWFSRGMKDKAFQEYPALTLRYHAQITAMTKSRVELPTSIDHSPRLWIWGPPGAGKSAYVAWKFPRAFKKSLAKVECQYFNGLDLEFHTHIYLEDIGPDAFEYIGMEQLKQWSDPSHGYTVSMKYGAPIYGVTLPLLVTSNYTPSDLQPLDQKFPSIELAALTRRFEVINIQDLLLRENIQLKSKEELKALKKEKNADFSKCFKPLECRPSPDHQPE